MIGYNLERF